ncbi:MAG: carboxypeptidase-like regulatory domain-containing protein [bacterium]|nr:carboxypeptidase-like regulatory domain-containing protein [bacterium]
MRERAKLFALVLVTLTLLLMAPKCLAWSESNNFILDDASIAPNFTGDSGNQSITATVSPLQNSQSASNTLNEAGVTIKAVLPTPLAPSLQAVDGVTKVLNVKISLGDNDRASRVQLRLVSTDGTYTGYFIPNSQAVSVSDSWVGYNSWGEEWRQLKELDVNKQYRAQVRVKTDDFSVSEFSAFSEVVTPNGILTAETGTPTSSVLPKSWQTSRAKSLLTAIATALLPLTAAALIIQAGAAISIIGELLLNLLGRLLASLLSLAQLVALAGRKKIFGQIMDSKTKKPVPGAQVSLLRPDTRRVLDMQTTDQYGRYYFIANNKQPYLLTINKEGFDYWEQVLHYKINRRIYLGESLENDVPLLKDKFKKTKLMRGLETIRVPLLLIGSISWLGVFIQQQSVLTWGLGVYYVLAWVLEIYIRIQPRPFGLVVAATTNEPLSLVVVRIYNNVHKLIETVIGDEQGRFKTLLQPGRYNFTFAKQGYKPNELNGIIIDRHLASLKVDVTMYRV